MTLNLSQVFELSFIVQNMPFSIQKCGYSDRIMTKNGEKFQYPFDRLSNSNFKKKTVQSVHFEMNAFVSSTFKKASIKNTWQRFYHHPNKCP